MSVTVVDRSGVRAERLDQQAEAVVTITVQITLAGDELPVAASRLISDLESLVGLEVAGSGPRTTPDAATRGSAVEAGELPVDGPSRGSSRGGRKAGQTHAGVRTLRLVGQSVDQPADDQPRVRRIGQLGEVTPSLFLHTASRLLLLGGAPVQLTRREYDLFQFFCENPRRVFTRPQLLRQVWGYDMVGTERTVDVHVRRLRVKLGECSSIIRTVRGVGYRLDDEAPFDIVVQED